MHKTYRSVSELAVAAAQDPQLQADIQANPAEAIAGVAAIPNDVWIYRIVVSALSVVALTGVIGAIILVSKGMSPPDILTALSSAAIGGLAGLLAPSPTP